MNRHKNSQNNFENIATFLKNIQKLKIYESILGI